MLAEWGKWGIVWMVSIFFYSFAYHFPFLSPSVWETARYRLKYCQKKLFIPKTTNQPTNIFNQTTIFSSTDILQVTYFAISDEAC